MRYVEGCRYAFEVFCRRLRLDLLFTVAAAGLVSIPIAVEERDLGARSRAEGG